MCAFGNKRAWSWLKDLAIRRSTHNYGLAGSDSLLLPCLPFSGNQQAIGAHQQKWNPEQELDSSTTTQEACGMPVTCMMSRLGMRDHSVVAADYKLMDARPAPRLRISITVENEVYHRKAAWGKRNLRSASELDFPKRRHICVDLRGASDAGCVLGNDFRFECFKWTDHADGTEVKVRNPFPGSCEPRSYLEPNDMVEPRKEFVPEPKQPPNDESEPADPVRNLETGYAYRVMRSKPQRVCRGLWLPRMISSGSGRLSQSKVCRVFL